MNREQIYEAITEVARDKVKYDGPLPEGPIVEQLDSLQLMTLVVAIEDRFMIIIDPEDEEKSETIADLVDIIETKYPSVDPHKLR